MSFHTALRRAADRSVPANHRLTSLSNAIEKFRLLGFHWTFEHLHLATGSQPDNWTPVQIDVAARLLADAHASWIKYLHDAEQRARVEKLQPSYVPRLRQEVFTAWRAQYFTHALADEWHVSDSE